MDEAENEKSFINLFIKEKGPKAAFKELRSFNFIAEDFVGTNMPLDTLQKAYSVDRLQKSGFDLKDLIQARQGIAPSIRAPLMIPSTKGGILGRIYTESIKVDFARKLLSAGLSSDDLHKELKTGELPLIRRIITNFNILRARLTSTSTEDKKTSENSYNNTTFDNHHEIKSDVLRKDTHSIRSSASTDSLSSTATSNEEKIERRKTM